MIILGWYVYILIAAAVIPAIFLVRYIYKVDSLDKEPPELIRTLVLYGALSTILALLAERLGSNILDSLFYYQDAGYQFALYFLLVGPAEEGFKYLVLKKKTWNNPNFNCQFDAIVYAVSVSLGFALWENIKYVFSYGISVALLRAVTAVPGHACFGVFMGVWYGVAKKQEALGNEANAKFFRIVAVVFPAIIHGCYDFIATMGDGVWSFGFVVFVLLMFYICYRVVKRLAAHDRYI